MGDIVPLVKIAVGLLVTAVAISGARAARQVAKSIGRGEGTQITRPFVPSPEAAPFVSLGYREAAADLLYVRMIGYFIGEDSTGHGVADLADAIVTLDPALHGVYDHAANAMTLAKHGVDQSVIMRAVRLVERGTKQFPGDWKLLYLAGQMYTQDLRTDDPAQRRAWDERGTLLVESAIRKPGAPSGAATWAAMMRTRLGQHQRAAAGLRELLLVTDDHKTRERLLAALAQLEERDAEQIAAEVLLQRHAFERRWKAERPAVNATMYILLGPRTLPGFGMTDLATGGRDLYVHDEDARLEAPH